MYYYDAPKSNGNSTNKSLTDYCFVTTVAKNKSIFTKREKQRSDLACELYAKLGHPSQNRFEKLITYINNCSVFIADAKNAIFIYGPNVFAIKGKSVKNKRTQVPMFIPLQVPSSIIDK